MDYLQGSTTFWMFNDHALRELRDVPPLLPSQGQKHATDEYSELVERPGTGWRMKNAVEQTLWHGSTAYRLVLSERAISTRDP